MDRILIKPVIINGKSYQIKKFDALTGLSIARLLLAKCMPLISVFGNTKESEVSDENLLDATSTLLESLTDEELRSIILKCLRYCYLSLPAGLQPVIDADGHYGDPDAEYDMMLTLKLCWEAIKLGASDFFDANGSDLKQQIIAALSQPNQSTTTPTFTPLS